MRIYIESFVCSRRRVEVSKFYNYFKINGFTIVSNPGKADCILVATCAFKKEEEDYSCERIGILNTYKAKLIVYGCLPEISPSRFNTLYKEIDWISPQKIDDIDYIFTNMKFKFSEIKDVNLIPSYVISQLFKTAFHKFFTKFNFSSEFILKSIAYLKDRLAYSINSGKDKYYLYISRGCLGKCSYCGIKKAVGTLKSKPLNLISQEFEEGIKNRYTDITVLGDDVGAYGLDINQNFPNLLRCLIDKADGIRFHIEEIHPKWLLSYRNEILELLDYGKIKSILCPIQSGNNRILQLMHREHDAVSIASLFSQIKLRQPKLKLTTQIIAGFPSETEAEFDDTLEFLKNIHFDGVTIFSYDEKENTPAAKIEPKITSKVIQQRVKKAQEHLKAQKIKTFLSCPR